LVIFDSSVRRLTEVSEKLVVDRKRMQENFDRAADAALGEPLQLLLSYHGHPSAHEYVRQLTTKSKETGRKLRELVSEDVSLKLYFDQFSSQQRAIFENPANYIGIASRKAETIANHWKERLWIVKGFR
jgi:adenylosuccinate lyase